MIRLRRSYVSYAVLAGAVILAFGVCGAGRGRDSGFRRVDHGELSV